MHCIRWRVQQVYLDLNESAKRIELSGASLQQANENLRLSNDRMKAGTITGKDVLEAQSIWHRLVTTSLTPRLATGSMNPACARPWDRRLPKNV